MRIWTGKDRVTLDFTHKEFLELADFLGDFFEHVPPGGLLTNCLKKILEEAEQ